MVDMKYFPSGERLKHLAILALTCVAVGLNSTDGNVYETRGPDIKCQI